MKKILKNIIVTIDGKTYIGDKDKLRLVIEDLSRKDKNNRNSSWNWSWGVTKDVW